MRIIPGILIFLVVLAAVVFGGLNTPAGFHLLEVAGRLGGVRIDGLGGRFPDRLHAQTIAMADAQGEWLVVKDAALNWSPTALVHWTVRAASLTASSVTVTRWPAPSTASSSASSSGPTSLPTVDVAELRVDRITLPEATLAVDGAARLDASAVDARLSVSTPDAAGNGPAKLSATLAGPRNAAVLHANADALGMTTTADGTLDLNTLAGKLALGIDHPAAGGASAQRIEAALAGDLSGGTVHATVTGLRLPGSQPDLLAASPVVLDGAAKLDTSAIDAKLSVSTQDAAGNGPVKLDVTLAGPRKAAVLHADVAALGMTAVANGPLDLDAMGGQVTLAVDHPSGAGVSAQRIEAALGGTLSGGTVHATITGLTLPGSHPALLGDAPVVIDAKVGPDLTLNVAAATASLSVQGKMDAGAVGADWRLVLPDLTAFAPQVAGTATLAGHVEGPTDNLTARTTIDAKLATGPLAGTVTLRGVPNDPAADVSLHGAWNGQDATVEGGAVRGKDGVFHVTIGNVTFQGAQAQAAFVFDPALGWPVGTATVHAARLPSPATGGTAQATIDFAAPNNLPQLTVNAEAAGVVAQGASLARAVLTALVTDPLGKPVAKGSLTATGLHAGVVTENVKLDVDGPANALGFRIAGTGSAAVQTAGVLDAIGSKLTLASLQVTGTGQTLRLTAPARIDFAGGLAVDRLRVALGTATLDITGRVAPALDLTASLRALPVSLLKLMTPPIDAEGLVQADARVTGSLDRPSGTVHLSATGLRMSSARYVPPAQLTASAQLDGTRAQLDATLSAGPTRLNLAGTAPLAVGGAYNLRATGSASLALLDPFLAAGGSQARGTIALDATLTGTEPRPAGTITLRGGSFTDAAQGVRLTDITATAHADTGEIILDNLSARAGGGPITGTGRVGLDGDMPLTVTLTARNISPLTSDALNTRLSADLTVSGAIKTAIAAGGTIRIARADIRIPEQLPSNLPTLTLRQPGPPPPPPAPPVPITLDITLAAPGQIYVRGRGIDAELAGRLHIGGTANAPIPEGGFELQRGQFSLAGQTLNFTTGRVSFDGHLPIDPTLNLVATSQGTNVIATLTITGTASHPKIVLSSSPELPQDEVLAQLLFHRSASTLGPLEIAQIAAGLAQIADVGGSGGIDPLGAIRSGLGLDVLSVGGAPGASSVQAGRNIARGVYLGAKQATSGAGTQATVRLDLARGLRLEADVGAPPPATTTTTPGAPATGNQVGITYEFDY